MAIDGVYNITIKTPMGDQQAKLTLKTDGDTLTGTSESAMTGVTELSEGIVSGNAIEWSEKTSSPMGVMEFNMKATVDGDKISGQAVSALGLALFDGNRES
jgi:hypothetical protein